MYSRCLCQNRKTLSLSKHLPVYCASGFTSTLFPTHGEYNQIGYYGSCNHCSKVLVGHVAHFSEELHECHDLTIKKNNHHPSQFVFHQYVAHIHSPNLIQHLWGFKNNHMDVADICQLVSWHWFSPNVRLTLSGPQWMNSL